MGNLLLSPEGRIGPQEFMKGVLILVAISVVLSLPQMLGILKPLQTLLGIVSIVLLYPWVVLWIKRYHDAGKSGWMSLVPILLYVFLFMILMSFMMKDMFMAVIEASSNGASEAEIETITTESTNTMMMTVVSVAFTLIFAFVFNKLIKSDPTPNQYG